MAGRRRQFDKVGGQWPYCERPAHPAIATWYYKAVHKALEGDAKRKYFEHAGALLTADGTDDDLIKLEGTPANYKLVIK